MKQKDERRQHNAAILKARLEQAQESDEYLKNNLDQKILDELGSDFFKRQVQQNYLSLAKEIQTIWDINDIKIDIENLESADEALLNILERVGPKLKQYQYSKAEIKDISISLNHIVANQDSALKSLLNDIKGVVQSQKKEAIIQSITAPFRNLWLFIRNHVSTLYHDVTLDRQINEQANFQKIEQSTHIPTVSKSIKLSLDKLDKGNPKAQVNEKEIIREIEAHIRQMDLPTEQKDYAFNTLLRAQDDSAIEFHTKRSIKSALTTMWTAAKDSNAYGPNDSAEDVKKRLNLIVTHMALADREYNLDMNGVDDGAKESRPACLTGTVNKITESPELIHPDVKIIRGKEVVADLSIQIYKEEFEKFTDEEQVQIYQAIENAYDEDDDIEFKEFNSLPAIIGIKKIINDKLQELNTEVFSGELDKGAIENYTKIELMNVPLTNAIKNHKESLKKPQHPKIDPLVLEGSQSISDPKTIKEVVSDLIKRTDVENEQEETYSTSRKL